MKKLLLILSAVLYALTASADVPWTVDTSNQSWDKEHVVYATLSNLAADEYASYYADYYYLGAFINDECRAVTSVAQQASGGISEPLRFELRIKGGADDAGQDISFKVFINDGNNQIYTLSQTLAYEPEGTTGQPSSLYSIAFNPAQAYYYTEASVTLYPDDTYTVPYAIIPEDGQLPDNFDDYFVVSSGAAVTLSGKEITAVSAGTAQISNNSGVSINGNTGAAVGVFTVNVVERPVAVTEIFIDDTKPTTIYVGNEVALHNYFYVKPDDASNKNVTVTADNDNVTITQSEAAANMFYMMPTQKGTTIVTITSESDPTVSATITFTIKRHVTAITPNSDADFTIQVGQTINLADYYVISPDDADNKNVEVEALKYSDFVSISGSGTNWTLTALKAGDAHVFVTAEENNNCMAELIFSITQPVESITETEGMSHNMYVENQICLNDYYTINPSDASNKEVTVSDTGKVSITPWEEPQSGEIFYYVTATERGQTTITVTSVSNPEAKVTLTFNILQPVTAITPNGDADFNIQVGQTINLADYYVISPEDADNKNVEVEALKYSDFVSISGSGTNWTLTALKDGDAHVFVTAEDNIDCMAELIFTITQSATDVEFAIDELNLLLDQTYTISGVTILPEGVSQAFTLSTSNADVVEVYNSQASAPYIEAKGRGEATITIAAADGSGASTTFTVHVYEGLEGFEYQTEISMPTQSKYTVSFYPYPYEAYIGGTLQVVIAQPTAIEEYNNSQANAGWKYVVPQTSWVPDEGYSTGHFEIELSAFSIGEGTIGITYTGDDLNQTIDLDPIYLHVGYEYELAEGWNWMSTMSDGNSDMTMTMQEMLGNDLGEARTQDGLLYNDPVYGYFGDFTDFEPATTFYKLKGKNANTFMLFGDYNATNMYTIRKGWTWLPYNCEYAQTIPYEGVEGDIIVSLTDGMAAYTNGAWAPADFQVKGGQGYMYFSNEQRNMTLPNPFECQQPDAIEEGHTQVAPLSVWNYNPRRFNTIMPMIAQIDGYDTDNYTIGAFVGNECRGEGRVVDGMWLITVAGENGERVSFRLYDKTTGTTIDVDDTVTMASMLGTTKAPVQLSAAPLPSAITTVGTDANGADDVWYNLQGQRVANPTNGIYIHNGRKVIVK